ncbi:MAG: cupin domain-containing protein [Dehalococcoidia bacterium]|nr:cupin domain-containing protein [Dehalococcoidia bacterium]
MKVRSIYTLPAKTAHNDTVSQWELFEEKEFSSSIDVFHLNIVNPGTAVEPHRHDNEEQVFFILSGVGKIKVGREERTVREGDAIYLPPRLTHTLLNTGTHPLRFLAIGAKIAPQ